MLNKINKLHQEIDVYNPDIIFLTETRLDVNKKDSELQLKDYNIFRRDRGSNGGGVLIATRTSVQGEEIYKDDEYEALAVSINLGNKIGKVKCVCVYRPHDAEDNAEVLLKIKQNIVDVNSNGSTELPVIIAGDLNLPHINWEEYRITSDIPVKQRNVSTLLNEGFEQVVKTGTRISQTGRNNILDVLLVRPSNLWLDTEVIKGFSDHDIPVVTFAVPCSVNKENKKKIYNYNKADQVGVITKLEEKLKNFIMAEGDVNKKWDMYKNLMQEIAEEFIPSKTISENSDPEYYNKEVKALKKKVRQAYIKYRRHNASKEELERMREKLENAKAEALNEYLIEIMQKNNKNKSWKSMYRHINNFKRGSQQIPGLKVEGKTYILDKEKAEILSKQYEKVYQVDPKCTNTTQNNNSSNTSMFELNENRLIRIIMELDGRKAAGPDGITSRLIKLAPVQQAKYIGHLIDKILEEERIPDEWKTATVIPIFKGGERNKPENYRPVSLTCIVCKLVEKCFEEYTESQLNSKKFYEQDQQHGFRRGFSCDTQLLGFTDDIIEAFKANKEIAAVFLDYEKAFDKVPHSLLVQKTAEIIDDRRIVNIISDFLSNRTIKVKVNETLSRDVKATSGVPQGSVLGPRLFDLFIQDLIRAIQNSKIRLFADDAVIYKVIEKEDDLKLLQEDLNRAAKWVDDNFMSLNVNKCKSVCFSRKKSKVDLSKLTLKGQPLLVESEYKYLGVILDSKLDWDQQVSKVVKSGTQTINFIYRNLKGTDCKVKLIAYMTLIRPILEYATAVWDPYTKTHRKQLEAVQNKAVRKITGNTRRFVTDENENRNFNYISVTALKSELEIQTLEDRRRTCRQTAMFKIMNELPGWGELKNRFQPGLFQSRHDHDRKVWITGQTTDYAKYSFVHRSSVEWNQLPGEAVNAASVKSFKSLVNIA